MTVLVGRLIEEARGAGVPTRIEAEAEAAVHTMRGLGFAAEEHHSTPYSSTLLQ